jgi:hypothetical protein
VVSPITPIIILEVETTLGKITMAEVLILSNQGVNRMALEAIITVIREDQVNLTMKIDLEVVANSTHSGVRGKITQ